MIKRLAVVILLLTIFINSLPLEAFESDNTRWKLLIRKPLRVCVLKDVESLTLTIKGRYKIFTLKTHELIEEGNDLRYAEVLPTMSGLAISGQPFNIYGIKIIPKKDASIYIGKRSFRGNLDIIRTEKKELLAINHVDIEDYLKGVLYHEVSHWWPMETLKAQAIASRTYALHEKQENINRDYDLTNDIYSQVYGGRVSERFKTDRAVNLTRGKVLTFNDKIFPTYYHATCGGHTEDASNLWNIELSPLKGIRCNFCRHSPHYRWRYKLPISEAERKLDLAGYNLKGLKDIKLEGKTSSGRVKELKIISDKVHIIPAKYFRLIVGPNFMRSTNFKIDIKGRYIYFNGRGWGHGVGMCQWGAFFLGLRRYRAQRILRYYYPGARLSKI